METTSPMSHASEPLECMIAAMATQMPTIPQVATIRTKTLSTRDRRCGRRGSIVSESAPAPERGALAMPGSLDWAIPTLNLSFAPPRQTFV
jgi:hypothetical protein